MQQPERDLKKRTTTWMGLKAEYTGNTVERKRGGVVKLMYEVRIVGGSHERLLGTLRLTDKPPRK